MDKKVVIDESALHRIKDFGVRRFHAVRSFNGMDTGETQAFLIVQGLYDYLKSQGIEPPFEVKCKQVKE